MQVQPTFFFYDLETSGLDPRRHRIMQFAGQRTDMELNIIGEPVNMLVSLSDDVLPDPQAVLVTGITPQKTREEGYSEADFLKILHEQVFTPGTIIVGYNSVRFDDEFMRYTLYRNFYDPYEWQWKDNTSRWDLLDVIRMARALRPEGIKWPIAEDGRPSNRLEHIATENALQHENAHDALSDVMALIQVARLLKKAQPDLFKYLLNLRHKKTVAEMVNLENPQPFVYASGRYPKDLLHTTVALPIAEGGRPGSAIVYDLRHDPSDWATKSVDELKKIRFATREQRQAEDFCSLPAKEIMFNRCPAIAPLNVLSVSDQQRLQIDLSTIKKHAAALPKTDLANKLGQVFASATFTKNADVDARLYDGFVGDGDKIKLRAIRAAAIEELMNFVPDFSDERLLNLLLRYKARNFPHILTEEERIAWEEYRNMRLKKEIAGFTQQLQRLASTVQSDEAAQFLLQELQLWAESIIPIEEQT